MHEQSVGPQHIGQYIYVNDQIDIMSAWVTALKEYNEGKDHWCVPRKGTKEYNEVKQLSLAYSGKGPIPDLADSKKKVKRQAVKKEIVEAPVESKEVRDKRREQNFDKWADKWTKKAMVEGKKDELIKKGVALNKRIQAFKKKQ